MKFIIIIAIAFVLFIPLSVFAEEQYKPGAVIQSLEEARIAANEELLEGIQVSIWTDKTDYEHNDLILVDGNVNVIEDGLLVTVTVISPLNSIVTIDQLNVDDDGSFETTLNTAGNMWKYDGTYTIKAEYGRAENNAKVNLSGGVEYVPNYSTPQAEPEPTSNSVSVTTDKASYSEGETIVITGIVSPLVEYSQSVTILVVSPDGHIVTIAQVIPDSDGSFSHVMGDSKITIEGEYKVRSQYGAQKITSTFNFILDGIAHQEPYPKPIAEPESLCGAGTYYDDITNSCKLDYITPNDNTTENDNLKKENTKLKIENKQLKNQINNLQEKLDSLQNIINEQIKVILDTLQELKNK